MKYAPEGAFFYGFDLWYRFIIPLLNFLNNK